MKLNISAKSWPMRTPFSIARGTTTVLQTLVVEVEDGPARGRGEAVGVDYLGESVPEMRCQLEGLRQDIERPIMRSAVTALLPPGGARNALDCALWDLEAKRTDVPAWKMAGLVEPGPLLTAFTIGLGTPAEMALKARQVRQYPLLKLKLDGTCDLARVHAVRTEAPDVRLVLDANESWTFEQLQDWAPQLAAQQVVLIEQPLPAARDAALAEFRSPIPLCADESFQDGESLSMIRGKYSVVSLKLDKTGGLTRALELASAARSAGLKLMVGCMAGSSLGMAPAMLVAQLCDFVDLDGPLLQTGDYEPGIRYDDGIMQPAPRALWG